MAIRMTRTGVALTVGIIVLTGLIIGGLFYVKELGEQARREEAIQIAEENLEAEANEDIALNEGETSGENEQAAGQAGDQASEGGASNGSTSGEAAQEELPQTGPADAGIFLLVGVIVYFGAHLLQSRRSLQ